MNVVVIILTCLSFTSCAQSTGKTTNTKIPPFELTVYDSDYSMAYSLQYVLTDKRLTIMFKSDLEGEKDTILFETQLSPNKALEHLSKIDIASLKESYENPCISDGSQISIKLLKDNKSKIVHLSNYYHYDVGIAIEIINTLVPEKYKIWYDKEVLLKGQKDCNIGIR